MRLRRKALSPTNARSIRSARLEIMMAPEDSPMPAKDMANSFDAVSGSRDGVRRCAITPGHAVT